MRIMYNELFLSHELQVWETRHLDRQYGWGLGDGPFLELPEPPAWPTRPHTAVTLVARLPPRHGKSGLERTVEEYWRKLIWPGIGKGGASSRGPDLRFDADHLVELGAEGWEPGLTWAVLDLAASWWGDGAHSPSYAALLSLGPGRTRLPGLEVLAAAAMHPKWLQAMDGTKTPFVWLPGLLLKIDGLDHKASPYTPALSYHKDTATTLLSASSSHVRHPSFAVPRFL